MTLFLFPFLHVSVLHVILLSLKHIVFPAFLVLHMTFLCLKHIVFLISLSPCLSSAYPSWKREGWFRRQSQSEGV